MDDRTGEVAERLGVTPQVVAVLLGAPWRRVSGDDSGGTGAACDDVFQDAGTADELFHGEPMSPVGAGDRTGRDRADRDLVGRDATGRAARGRMYVGVPSPAELRELDLPADGLRHFGLSPAELRAGGWTDADLRSAGLTPPGAAPEPTTWFVAGEPAQLMLGLGHIGPPLLARPEPGWDGHIPTLDPADVVEVPDLLGCGDPEDDAGLHIGGVRDGLLRKARRRLTHCAVCLCQVHRADTTGGACHACAQRWLGIVY